jgi:hypothetical protein
MKFNAIKETEKRIEVWGWMDDVVHATKPKRVVDFWENYGVPHKKKDGGLFVTSIFGGKTAVDYEAICWNRFWFKTEFEKCDWKRVCETFAQAMSL